ncbi:DUF6492 family protein [Frigidibacter mobilis]|uniref:Uncharacterized protein n=1 Tax=Frigidibacter mobilis TaxID=1335048 RepID=A0A159Z5G2_9RHOB|nr:DUF6492 family protein [Frigidibacter mobilis]AMY69638.1 hypothetical protein AKL17_2392 [Frigidibacter mobilis]
MQGGATIDFVTVCFRTELPLLRLQARSMDRFLDPAGVGRILVIANDEDEAACIAAFEAIRPDWGRHAPRVEFVRGTSLMPLRFRGPLDRLERAWVSGPRCAWRHWRDRLMGKPRTVYGWALNSGWLMQQAFKLYAARRVTASHAVILDAKNFFVAPVGAGLFVTPDGRARAAMVPPIPKVRIWAEASARRIGGALTPRETMPDSTTPVVLRTEDFVAGLDRIERAVGPLECFFARRSAQSTEFMMLYAATGGGNAAWEARFAPIEAPWIYHLSATGPGDLARELAACATRAEPILALHRRWLFRIGAEDRAALSRYLVGRGLFAGEGEVEDFLAT